MSPEGIWDVATFYEGCEKNQRLFNFALAAFKLFDESVMLRGRDPGLQDLQHFRHVAGKERSAIEPKSRKDARAMYAVGAGGEELVGSLDEAMPANLLLFDDDDDILLNAATLIKLQLFVQINGDARQGDFRDQFGSAFDVLIPPGGAPEFGQDRQVVVRLR